MAAPPIVERHKPHFHRRAPFLEKCRVATTANITISTALNNGDTLDGISLVTGDRVLVKDQTSASENGIYEVGASPARAYDESTDDPNFGYLVFVVAGTANAGTLWKNTNTSAPTIGSTSITYSQVTVSSIAASAVTVADAGGYFTGTNVEDVLQELASKDIGYTAHGNTGSTETFSALTGWHSATLDANCTFTFTGATSGVVAAMILELAQDSTGGRTVTWPGSVVWPGGTAPTLSTTASATDILTFFSRDGGTNWFGFIAGGGGSSTTTTGSDHEHVENVVFSGDGATTVWTLPVGAVDATSIDVYVTGSRSIAWVLSGTIFDTLTFDSAPASATNNIVVDIVAAVV